MKLDPLQDIPKEYKKVHIDFVVKAHCHIFQIPHGKSSSHDNHQGTATSQQPTDLKPTSCLTSRRSLISKPTAPIGSRSQEPTTHKANNPLVNMKLVKS
jgi:hypothetical protein